jgi:hypothetical protein
MSHFVTETRRPSSEPKASLSRRSTERAARMAMSRAARPDLQDAAATSVVAPGSQDVPSLGERGNQGAMTIIDQAGTMPKAPLGPLRQLLPLAGLTVAVVANIAWIGFLLYAAYDLAVLA